MNNKLWIIQVVCGYKLCYNWKCPFSEDGVCVARKLSDKQIKERFTHTLTTNPDFRSYIAGRDRSLLKGCIMK